MPEGIQDDHPVRDGLLPNEMVDHYRIIRPLGAGGMAEVYLARDTMLGRKVALKIVQPKRSEKQDSIDRFLFEAKVTAQFNHPHIITIHSVGTTDHGPYLALEYLEGQTLRQRLEQERLSTKESIRIGIAIAQALRVAHQKDLLHRDLKPENIMLAKDGRLRVLDFGLSRLLGDGDLLQVEELDQQFRETRIVTNLFLSNQKKIKGTPAYMAPEQWRAEELGPPTDVWALGLILYEMLAGYHPYYNIDKISDLAAMVSDDSLVPPPSVQGHVPFRLQEILSQCLAKDPQKRPSAHELTLVLDHLLEGDRQKTLSDTCPFRGLVPFEEEHSSLYFGREAEVGSFVERLRTEPILPVVGLSGAGKSSFIKAGVVPRLREKGPLILIQMRPGRDPFFTLASRLVQVWQRPTTSISSQGSVSPLGNVSGQIPRQRKAPSQPISTPQDLARELYQTPSLLGLWLHKLADRHRLHIVLFVDQLEELWALPKEAQIAHSSVNSGQEAQGGVLDRFMQAVCTAADDPQLPVRVFLTLREEFISHLMTSGQVREALSRIVVLRKPSQKTLVDILDRSVKTVGYQFEDVLLANEMVTEVQNSQSAFSLIQFAGQVLWHNRDEQRRVLTRAAFENMGGVTGALVQHADGVLKGLNAMETDLARALLLRLVTENKTKRIIRQRELVNGLEEGAEQVLDRLVESRLVIISRKTPRSDKRSQPAQADNTQAVKGSAQEEEEGDCELVHEALIANWDRLCKWIDESSEELRLRNQLEQAALLWNKRGRRIEELWSKQALQEIEVLNQEDLKSNPLMKEFRQASQRHLRKRRNHQIAVFAGMALVLFVGIFAGNKLLQQDLCTGAQQEIATIWNPQVSQTTDKALLSTGVSYASDTIVRVRQILDAYSNEWADHYTQTCEATHIKGEQSNEVLDLRMGCLLKCKRELGALLGVFSTADSGVVQRAVQASKSLTSIASCADAKALRAHFPPPKNAQLKAKVALIREKLATVDAYEYTGKYKKGLTLAKELQQQAKQTDYRPIQAATLFRLGNLLERNGQYQEAEEILTEASRVAGQSGNAHLAARAMVRLVWIVGYRQARNEDGVLLSRSAEVLLGLDKKQSATQARLLNYLGVIFLRLAKHDKATGYFRQSLSIMEKMLGPQHPNVASLYNNLGLVYREKGEYSTAIEYYRKGLVIRDKALGSSHPVVGHSLHNIGYAYQNQKEYAKAFQHYQRSLAIMENALGSSHPDTVSSLIIVGGMFREKGEHRNSLAYLHKARKACEKTLGPEHPLLISSLFSIATTLMDQGRPNQALEPFQRLVSLCDRVECDPGTYGRGLLGLAKAMAQTSLDKEQSIRLARKAQQLFSKTPPAFQDDLKQVEAWLGDKEKRLSSISLQRE